MAKHSTKPLKHLDDEQKNIALFNALEANKSDDIRKIFLEGANPNAKGKDAITPLHKAAEVGNPDIIDILIREGGNVEAIQENVTPIECAAQHGHVEAIKSLLRGNAKIPDSVKDAIKTLGEYPLHRAAQKGDIPLLSYLLAMGKDINQVNVHGDTPLHYACWQGHTHAVELLLAASAKVNVKNNEDATPLHKATPYPKITELLISHDAEVNAKTLKGHTPLDWALTDGQIETARLLHQHKATTYDIDIGIRYIDFDDHMEEAIKRKDIPYLTHRLATDCDINDAPKTLDGRSLLHIAARYKNPDILDFFFRNGAFRMVDHYKNSPIHVAAHFGNPEIIDLLLQHGENANASNQSGLTPLDFAIKTNQLSSMKFLLQNGALADGPGNLLESPIHLALALNNVAATKLLIDHGATLPSWYHDRIKDAEYPLHEAAKGNDTKFLTLLLAQGHDVNVQDREGRTPLHDAVEAGESRLIELLTNNNANINAKDKKGLTPLHYASMGKLKTAGTQKILDITGDNSIVTQLIEKGANVNAASNKGSTPLHFAAQNGFTEIATALLNAGAKIQTPNKAGDKPITLAATNGDHKTVAFFLKKGNSVEPKAFKRIVELGKYPLHKAIRAGDTSSISYLLALKILKGVRDTNVKELKTLDPKELKRTIPSINKSSLNALDHTGTPLLHLAVWNNRISALEALLKLDADTNITTGNGFTPLHAAVWSNNVLAVQLLLKHGANIEATTQHGNTPLHLAALSNNARIMELLIQYKATVDAKNKDGQTPLYLAVFSNQPEVIKCSEQKSHPHLTPENVADVIKNRVAVIEMLLKNGASPDIIGKEELNDHLLYLIEKPGALEIVKILVQASPVPYASSAAISIANYEEIIKMLLSAGMPYNNLSDSLPIDLKPSDFDTNHRLLLSNPERSIMIVNKALTLANYLPNQDPNATEEEVYKLYVEIFTISLKEGLGIDTPLLSYSQNEVFKAEAKRYTQEIMHPRGDTFVSRHRPEGPRAQGSTPPSLSH
ncbi:MAG: serine/threonine-protein phosphatase 6 regulatory ankyrin repeat subunit A-like [Rickettsiales bacterium]|jgi:ankyrin|nr:serine/threonine-protein phosphatase 6 regulatory ankyrin repeat subunit A-like [Rickettsiales bacterium]